MFYSRLETELDNLSAQHNLRVLPRVEHDEKWLIRDGQRMLNLSSNDYLGLATDKTLRAEFLSELTPDTFLPSASSSRLLTGNFAVYEELEAYLASLYGSESALVFNCGYHANTGILPALADKNTLILADKLVHASLIDGLRLGEAKFLRFRHNDLVQLAQLLAHHAEQYHQVIVVVESIYSMDGDVADLNALVALKRRYHNVLLYVDEAHGVGVCGRGGLGLAEELGCVKEIDFLMGTFGKALASTGAFLICQKVVRDYLVNRMRPFIFTTALPPVSVAWSLFVMKRLADFDERRVHLQAISVRLRNALEKLGFTTESNSQIVPWILGESEVAMDSSLRLQRLGFYALPVRPPTVPVGSSRIRFSLSAALTDGEMTHLVEALPHCILSSSL